MQEIVTTHRRRLPQKLHIYVLPHTHTQSRITRLGCSRLQAKAHIQQAQ